MSFESFPDDAIKQYNDPGPFYIREHGKLRSPGLNGMNGLGQFTQLHSTDQQRDLTSASFTDAGNMPRKLYDLTLDFVAARITMVESLVGFPEIVGQEIFQASLQLNSLNFQALKLFTDAYENRFLETLNLRGHHLVLDQHLDSLTTIFPSLAELEVGDCGLGDYHEILPTIANCQSLRRLGLSSNGLSDISLQGLTAPLRVMGRGLRNLQVLDLADNKNISDRSASRYLISLTSIQALDLSGCGISSTGLDSLKSKLGLVRRDVSSSDSSPFQPPVGMVGWASSLIDTWKASSTNQMQKAVKSKTTHTAVLPVMSRESLASRFYARAGKRLENVSGRASPKQSPPIHPIIQLVAVTTTQTSTYEPVSKRKVPMVNTKLGGSALPDKDLLKQYGAGMREETENKQGVMGQSISGDGRPPPKKRIKLCCRVWKGLSDDSNAEVEQGMLEASPNKKQSMYRQKSTPSSYCGFKATTKRSSKDESQNAETSSKLWKAMQSEDWCPS